MNLWVISSSYPTRPDESINAGVLSRDLALSLRDRGHVVTVFTPAKPQETQFDQGLTGHVIPWFRPSLAMADLRPQRPVDGLRASSLMINGYRLTRAVARAKPPEGIIAVWGLPSGLFARSAASVSGAKYCVWLLGSDVWRAPKLPGGVRLLRQVIKDSTATFANSEDLTGQARALTGMEVEYLPSVRRLPRGDRIPATSDLVFVGRLHPNKGPDLLLEALHLAAGWGIRPTTDIYGSGDMESSLRSRIAEFGLSATVRLHGSIEATPLAAALRSARLLVIPSRIDSTPLVLGEAIQTQTPVLVTDVGDTGSLVRRFGLGQVVEPGDPAALARGIKLALEQPDNLARDWAGANTLMSPDLAVERFLAELEVRAPNA